MTRVLKNGLLILFSVLLIAVLGVYLFRVAVLESFIARELNQYGLPLHALTVEEFSLNSLRVHDVDIGPHHELNVQKIHVTWQLSELLAGQPIAILIDGLHVMLDVQKESPFLRPPMTSSSGNITIPWLPIASLTNSAIHLKSMTSDMTITMSGHILQPQLGKQEIRFDAIADGSLGRAHVELTGTVTSQGQGQVQIVIKEGSLDLPPVKIAHFSGESGLALEAFQLQNLSVDFALSAIRITDTEPPAKRSSEIPAEIAAIEHVALKGLLRNVDRWTGELDVNVNNGQLTADPINIRQLSIIVPMRIENQQDAWRVGLRDLAQIFVGKMDYGTQASLKKPAVFSISQADLGLKNTDQGWTLDHALAISTADLSVSIKRAESSPVEAHIQPGKIFLNGQLDNDRDYQGRFTLNDAALLLPQSRLGLRAISLEAQLGDATRKDIARFTIGQVQHQAPQPYFNTASIAGNLESQHIEGRPMSYLLNLTAGVPSLRYLKLTAEHAPDNGEGNLTVQLAPLRFKPKGLQPGALFPVLEAFENVTGSVNASAHIDWKKQGVSHSQGKIDVQGISFTHKTANVNGLNAMLSLNDLFSLSSPPRQSVTVRRIDPGVPLDNLHISYQIKPAKLPRIALESTRFSLMDGSVSLAPTVINPASTRSDLLVHIDHINLATFFDVINVKGLTGTGHLSGDIPITLEKKRVLITNGHLAAKAPGILRFQSEKAAQLLADAGEEMNLLLQAMQDFHYSELSLTLDKTVEQDLIAKLSLLGNNPAVEEGRPFRLNVKLETDIDKILDTINQGYNLSHEILRGSFKLN